LRAGFVRGSFAGPARAEGCPWKKASVRLLELRGRRTWQFTLFDGRKTHVQNLERDAAETLLRELAQYRFAAIHLATVAESFELRNTKRGGATVGRGAGETAAATPHNRPKDVPLPEGERLLEWLGLAGPDGKIKPTMRGKYTQVNEFLKQFDHVYEMKNEDRPLQILDCGSGAGYLTLALHYYLNTIRQIPAAVVGVEVNEDLVRKSVLRAESAGAAAEFCAAPIRGDNTPADILVALHACDTATDDAIIRGVRGGAQYIFCAPCCHRYLNRQLSTDGPLKAALRHGILRERTADILTDAFRASALRRAGYRCDVVEFVPSEHTPRNVLLRAVHTGPAAEREFAELKAFCGVSPYIETLFSPEAGATA
jgi:SAM-dependent methyltransferase